MSTIIEQIIKAYDGQPQPDKRNMMKEIMRKMALCGLSKAGFFKKATFYGGTALPGIHAGEKIRIKFEVDTNPPDHAGFEHQYRLLPSTYEVALYDAPSLFAGNIHAVLCRAWKKGVKGRDLYDYVFFLSRNTPVNLAHLRARLIQSGYLKNEEDFSLAELKQHLYNRFEAINYGQTKDDVVPFIRSQASLQVWKADFFKQITGRLADS